MSLSHLIHVTLRHFENRLFELATSIMMVAIAGHLAIWPHSLQASLFRFELELMRPSLIAGLMGIGGLLRLAALVANGSWPVHGPRLRACGAIIGAMVWSQMGTSLVLYKLEAGMQPSPGIWVYLVLTSVELIAMCRALVDDGRNIQSSV